MMGSACAVRVDRQDTDSQIGRGVAGMDVSGCVR